MSVKKQFVMDNVVFAFLRSMPGAYVVYRDDPYRFIVFFAVTCIQVLGFPLHLFGVYGSDNSFLFWVTSVHWFAVIVFFLLFVWRLVSVYWAFSLYALMAQVVHAVRIVFLTTVQPGDYIHFIILNEFLSFIGIFVLVMSYIRYMPIVMTLFSCAVACYPLFVIGDRIYFQFMILFLFLDVFICMLGEVLYRKIRDVEDENKSYHERESAVLRAFGIDMREFAAYIELSTRRHKSHESVDELFKVLGKDRAHNIADAVKMWEYINKMRKDRIKRAFPTLTPVELEVAGLIMQGKSLRDICEITNKTENNIGTVRIHIRKKLGLKSDVNLNDYLSTYVMENIC